MSSVKIVLLLRFCGRGDFNLLLTDTFLILRNHIGIVDVLNLLFYQDSGLVNFYNSSAKSRLECFELLSNHDFLHSFAAVNVHKWFEILLLCVHNEFYRVKSVEY